MVIIGTSYQFLDPETDVMVQFLALEIVKPTVSENMSQNVCWFNRFGYCRFGNHCFRKHINIICENVNCEIVKCSSRHPRKCKYFLEYQKCKFGEYCRFSHGIPNNPKNMEKIEALEKEVEVLKQEIKHMKDHIDMKGSQLKMIQTEVKEKVVIIQKVELASKYLEKELEDSSRISSLKIMKKGKP